MKRALLPAMVSVVVLILFASCASAPRSSAASEKGEASREEPAGAAASAPAPAEKPSTPAPAAAPEEKSPAAGTRSAEVAGDESKAMEFMTEPGAPSLTPGSGEAAAAPRREAAGASGLQAGFADDNKQFNYFVNFLDQYAGQVPHFPIAIQERVILRVTDQSGKPIPNARVVVSGGGKALAEGATYADGTFLFFPSEHDSSLDGYTASVSGLSMKKEAAFQRDGKRQVDIQLQAHRSVFKSVPLDILFILDTTGSMGEEIERLKATIEIINLNIGSLSSKPKVRFGLVLYRDREDEYVTRTVALTDNVQAFQRELDKVGADGGGDDPEDMQAALKNSVKDIAWDPSGIRLAFIITDAPPHLDYGDESYTYVDASHDARAKGIKIFSVGTGGLDLAGEIVLRQISQYTNAKFIFLTYGEEGESGGGAPGSVSHHTGSNFQTDKLEAIIIRFAKEELAWLTDQPLTDEGDYFQAVSTSGEEKGETLGKLFDMAISQIIDYASIGIPSGTPTGALPIVPQANAQAVDAEYFSEQLVLSLARSKTFSAVERKDLQALLKELELQMSGITEESNAAKLGKMIGARMLVSSTMYDRGENFEIFLKLLRVETGEILSVTKLVVDRKLGLSPSR